MTVKPNQSVFSRPIAEGNAIPFPVASCPGRYITSYSSKAKLFWKQTECESLQKTGECMTVQAKISLANSANNTHPLV
jgi:phosphoribosylformylglycinamidine (FGAM) synthase-like amidotransferase family enzyme